MIMRKKVAVIGGGVSGLAAAKAFQERGHIVVGFERSHDFGGVWEPSRSYPSVQTQSPKDLYCFTDFPMPDDYPEWPSGRQVHAYLHAYAAKHATAPLFQLNTNVVSMDRRQDGAPGWTLTLNQGGQTRAENFDFVAIATGQFSEKNIVTHPGQDAFVASGGKVLHSSEYTDPALVKGKRVVVLGGSKSGTDIAVNAAASGAKSVTLVYRKDMWRVPYFIAGTNFKHMLYMRFQESQFNGWGRTPLQRIIAAMTGPLVWANFRGLEMMLKLQLGLKKRGMVPDEPVENGVSCGIAVVTPGLYEAFDAGTIQPVRGSFEAYEADNVRLTNGQVIGCDLAVLAVGWNQGIPYLAPEYQTKLIEPDGQYRVYRYAVNPDLPDMGFVGFNSSFCTVLSAELIANWLVRHADGQLARSASTSQMRDNIEMMLKWKRTERPAARIYGGLCTAPFHYRHFDEILEDIGAKVRKLGNPLLEYFSYPKADVYGRFLASAPQYKAE